MTTTPESPAQLLALIGVLQRLQDTYSRALAPLLCSVGPSRPDRNAERKRRRLAKRDLKEKMRSNAWRTMRVAFAYYTLVHPPTTEESLHAALSHD